jgi:hypothetical protein
MGADRTAQKDLFFLTIDQDGLRELRPEELTGQGPATGQN